MQNEIETELELDFDLDLGFGGDLEFEEINTDLFSLGVMKINSIRDI